MFVTIILIIQILLIITIKFDSNFLRYLLPERESDYFKLKM